MRSQVLTSECGTWKRASSNLLFVLIVLAFCFVLGQVTCQFSVSMFIKPSRHSILFPIWVSIFANVLYNYFLSDYKLKLLSILESLLNHVFAHYFCLRVQFLHQNLYHTSPFLQMYFPLSIFFCPFIQFFGRIYMPLIYDKYTFFFFYPTPSFLPNQPF